MLPIGLFKKKKIVIPLLEILMESSRGRVKVVGISGGTLKIEEKHGFPGGQCKNGKFQGGHRKFDWESRGVNFKKINIPNRGVQFFTHFLKKLLYL